GLGSLMAGVLGAVSFEAFQLFGGHLYGALGPTWTAVMPLLLTGPLLIFNLYTNPGGLAGWAFEKRDDWLRKVAQRRGIHVGALVALLGTNGAGESTLLKAVSGLVHPIAGRIVFDGLDITNATPMRTTELGIVQVPGGKAVFPTLTVAEHFKAGQWLYARQDA